MNSTIEELKYSKINLSIIKSFNLSIQYEI